MANPAEHKTYFTYEEYLVYEAEGDGRYEYFRGELFAMAGTTKSHSRCVRNVGNLLASHFEPQGCEAYTENIKLEVIAEEFYTYPDALVSCSERDLAHETLVRDPILIVEVLSKGTEKYDMDIKQAYYLKIPSLRTYLLVSRKAYLLHVFERPAETWNYRIVSGLDGQLHLETLGLVLSLADIYQNVSLENPLKH